MKKGFHQNRIIFVIAVCFIITSCGTNHQLSLDVIDDVVKCDIEKNIAQCEHDIYLSDDVILLRSNIYKKSDKIYSPIEPEGEIKRLITGKKRYSQYHDCIIFQDGENSFSVYNVSCDTYKVLSLEPYISFIIEFAVCDKGMLCFGVGPDNRRCILFIDPDNMNIDDVQIGESQLILDIIASEDNSFILLITDESGLFYIKMKDNYINEPQEIMAYDSSDHYSISAIHKDVLYVLVYNRRTEDNYIYYGFDMNSNTLTDQRKLENPTNTLRIDTENNIITIPWSYWRGSGIFYDDSRQVNVINRTTNKQESVKVDLNNKEKMVGFTVVEDTLVFFIEDTEKDELSILTI